MESFENLLIHLENKHNIKVQKTQEQDLRNIGYYHGFKGYRFVRTEKNMIPFSNMKEISALNKFDLNLKSIFYPRIMYIENALKSYFIESVLLDAQSEEMAIIYTRTVTNYKNYQRGSNPYKKEFKKRMDLQMKINSALIRDYQKGRKIEEHFFNEDKPIPVWAVFESLTLGEFGTFFECSNLHTRSNTSKLLHLPTNLDADGALISFIIFVLRDLRNAVAHNSVIFDTRFQTSKINKRLIGLLEAETGIKNIDFKYISSYIILVSYLYKKMGMNKQDCTGFVHQYMTECNYLFKNLQKNTCFEILGTNNKTIMFSLEQYISKK